MNILEQLNSELEKAKPNIIGTRYASIDVDGVAYSAISSISGSHNSANCWCRVSYRKDGKIIAKDKLI